MPQILVSLLGVLLLGLAVLGTLFVGGMRAKWPPVIDTVRRLNLKVLNPQQVATAGTPGAFAGLLRHTGRRSGTAYETPLGIEPFDDGFVIALVYGGRTEWLKNVLAAGHASVVYEGQTYLVGRPRVVPISEVAEAFSAADRRYQRMLAVDSCLRLRRLDQPD